MGDNFRVCAVILVMIVLVAAEIYFTREVFAVITKLLDPPAR
ncbi:MAG TPA: hypothetical protein VNL35_16770 [Chloroflexota bacterium]|nr:hypothetical protein [Chloroflexota bacterium]